MSTPADSRAGKPGARATRQRVRTSGYEASARSRGSSARNVLTGASFRSLTPLSGGTCRVSTTPASRSSLESTRCCCGPASPEFVLRFRTKATTSRRRTDSCLPNNVRRRQYSGRRSRFRCGFAVESIEPADAFRAHFGQDAGSIWWVRHSRPFPCGPAASTG